MTTFLALYRGDSIGAAKMVAVSADPRLVGDFAARLLEEQPPEPDEDPVVTCIEEGRRRALRVIRNEGA